MTSNFHENLRVILQDLLIAKDLYAAQKRITELLWREPVVMTTRLEIASRLMAAQRLEPTMALDLADSLISADRETAK